MRRTLSFAVGLILLVAPPATAKELVERARACGTGDCSTVAAGEGSELLFELLAPAIEVNRRSKAPPSADSEPRYRIALHVQPGGVVRIDYLPGPAYIRVHGRHAGNAQLNRGWVQLVQPNQYGDEVTPYQELVQGLTPFPGSHSELTVSDDGSGFPWLAVLAVVFMAGLASLLSFLRVSTRLPRSPASS